MAGRPKTRAKRELAALEQLAEDDADLQDRVELHRASTSLLADGPGTMPDSIFRPTTLGPKGLEIEHAARRAVRRLTVEAVQDRALADWMERRQMLLDIIDGKETTYREALDKEGNLVRLEVAPTISERLKGLELLARYSSMGRKADREALERPEQALAELLGLSVEEVKALAVEPPQWSLVDGPPADLDLLEDHEGPPRTA